MPSATAAAAATPGYRPRSYTNDLKDIIEDCLDELVNVWDERFRETYGPLPSCVVDLLRRYVRCGDPHYAACAAERNDR